MRGPVAGAWPDPDEAVELIERELSDARYSQAEPTWWDKFVSSIAKFFANIFDPTGLEGVGSVTAWAIVGVIAALVIAALVIWGRPRLSLSSRATPDALFGEDDSRSARELRAAADERAWSGDWDGAIVLRVRAFARALQERGIVVLAPGATVQQFATEASASFPSYAGAIGSVAQVFDSVRYVKVAGTMADYQAIADLDGELERSRPTRLSALPSEAVRA